MSSSQQAFPRSVRLLSAVSFQRVFKQPWKSSDDCFVVLARPNNGKTARLGLAVAKKNARRAIDRNRFKRVIRESFREHQALLSSLDVVVLIKPTTIRKDNAALFNSLEKHWQQLANRKDKQQTLATGV